MVYIKPCYVFLYYLCDPVGIQTQDLQNRNLTLYSAKLRDLYVCLLFSKQMQRYKNSFNSATNLRLFFFLLRPSPFPLCPII